MAKYKDIADDIRQRIFNGEFPVGGRLPPLLALADHYGVALNTVRPATSILKNEGLIRITPGERTVVIRTPDYDKITLLDKLRQIREDVDRIRLEVDGVIRMVEEST